MESSKGPAHQVRVLKMSLSIQPVASAGRMATSAEAARVTKTDLPNNRYGNTCKYTLMLRL